MAPSQCGPDGLVNMLGAGGGIKQQFGGGPHDLVAWVQQDFTNGFGNGGAAGLAGNEHVATFLPEALFQQADLRALTAAFYALEGDEEASHSDTTLRRASRAVWKNCSSFAPSSSYRASPNRARQARR